VKKRYTYREIKRDRKKEKEKEREREGERNRNGERKSETERVKYPTFIIQYLTKRSFFIDSPFQIYRMCM
jgi:hypothetical protein